MDEIKCPKCGGLVECEDCMDYEVCDDYVVREMVGTCVDCGAEVAWDDVYKYTNAENIRVVEG